MDVKAEFIDPALKGTLNLLKSCAKFLSIKRVIVTSSMAPVTCNGKPMNSDVVVDETWFSDPALCEKLKMWYALSKTLAEKAAWNFAKENGIDLVIMNPGFTIGPILQPTLSFSVEIIRNLINDVKDEPSLYQISNEKAKSLGINFIPWEVSLRDTVESLKEKGSLNV